MVKSTDFDQVPSNASFSENMQVSAGLWVRRSLHEDAPGNALDEPNDVEQKRVIAPTGSVSILPHYIDDERNYKDIGSAPGASFTMHVSPKPAREVLMVLKDTQVCEHGSYFGGIEREFHRGANGHTRHATCKDQDCNKTIIVAKRKDASQLWRYLVQIALRTKWGRQDLVSSSQMSARHETRHLPMMRSDEHSTRLSTTARIPYSTASWDQVSRSKDGSSPSSTTARIVRPGATPEPRFWAYGLTVS